MKKITGTNQLSYDKFGELIYQLTDKIINYSQIKGIKFDAVAPIFRSGGVLGSILATRLDIVPMIPVQIKNNYKQGSFTEIFEIPALNVDIPSQANILICDSKINSGKTLIQAIKLLRQTHPDANLYFATLIKTESSPSMIAGLVDDFVGMEVDEKKSSAKPILSILPWESAENEVKDIDDTSMHENALINKPISDKLDLQF